MVLATNILMVICGLSSSLAVYLAWTLREGGGRGPGGEEFDLDWSPDPGGLEIDWDGELRRLNESLVSL